MPLLSLPVWLPPHSGASQHGLETRRSAQRDETSAAVRESLYTGGTDVAAVDELRSLTLAVGAHGCRLSSVVVREARIEVVVAEAHGSLGIGGKVTTFFWGL